MKTRLFDITFSGQPLTGFLLETVKNNIQTLFGADQDTVDQMFSGHSVILKSGLDRQTATKYQAALSKAGAQIQITVCSDKPKGEKAKTTADPVREERPQSGVLEALPATGNILSAAEKPELQTVSIPTDHLSTQPISNTDNTNIFLAEQSKHLTEETAPNYPSSLAEHVDSSFTIAESGSNLLNENEKTSTPIINIDVSHIELVTEH